MTTQTSVCDSCVIAMLDEAEESGLDLSWDDAIGLSFTMGADIADHICDNRDAGKPCSCACRLGDK